MSHVFSHSNRKRNKCLLDLPGEAREAGEDWTRSDLKMVDNNVAGSHCPHCHIACVEVNFAILTTTIGHLKFTKILGIS